MTIINFSCHWNVINKLFIAFPTGSFKYKNIRIAEILTFIFSCREQEEWKGSVGSLNSGQGKVVGKKKDNVSKSSFYTRLKAWVMSEIHHIST